MVVSQKNLQNAEPMNSVYVISKDERDALCTLRSLEYALQISPEEFKESMMIEKKDGLMFTCSKLMEKLKKLQY